MSACVCLLEIPHLFLSEKLCVHHLDLYRDQGEGLERQTAPVSVVVLETQRREQT